MMDALKWENEILQHSIHAPRQATPQCSARSHCSRTTPTQPHPPPHQQLLAGVGSQLPNANGHAQSQNADNQHLILLVNAPNVSGSGRLLWVPVRGLVWPRMVCGCCRCMHGSSGRRARDPAGRKEAAPCCWVCGREVRSKQGGHTGDGDNGRGLLVSCVSDVWRTKQRTIPFLTCHLKTWSKPAKLTQLGVKYLTVVNEL